MTKTKDLASSITSQTKQFLIDHGLGKHPAVPDSAWHGNDCWVIRCNGGGWHLSDDGQRVQSHLLRASAIRQREKE